MAVDRRRKDNNWNVLDENGSFYMGSYEGAQLAVLMDIRDELKRLNNVLHCQNFMEIPYTLKGIRRKLPTPKPRAPKAK